MLTEKPGAYTGMFQDFKYIDRDGTKILLMWAERTDGVWYEVRSREGKIVVMERTEDAAIAALEDLLERIKAQKKRKTMEDTNGQGQ